MVGLSCTLLVLSVCYESRSKPLRSWISEKVHSSFLSTAIKSIKRTHPTRAAEITGMLQGIEFSVVKY